MAKRGPAEQQPLLLNEEGDDHAAVVGALPAVGAVTPWLALCAFLGSTAIAMTWAPIFAVFNSNACVKAGFDAHCSNATKTETTGANQDGGSMAGSWALVLNVTNFLVIAALGQLSDAVGRKWVLTASIVGSIGTFVPTAIFGAAPGHTTMVLYITAFTSLCGGQYAQTSGIFAMMGDVTTHLDATERTIVFAKVVLAMYLGLVVGPLMGGTLIAAKIITNAQALLVASGLFLLEGFILNISVPETRNRAARTRFSFMMANPLGGIACLASDPVTLRVLLLELMTYCTLVGSIAMTVNTLQFADPKYMSFFYSAFFFMVAAGNVFLPAVIRRAGIRGTIRISTAVFALTMPLLAAPFYLGFVKTLFRGHVGLAVCLLSAPQMVGAMWDAPCRTLAVSRHPANRIGLATAGLVSLQSLTQGVASKGIFVLATYGYKHQYDGSNMSWLGYAVAAGCAVVAVVIALTIPSVITPPPGGGDEAQAQGAVTATAASLREPAPKKALGLC